MDYIARSKMYIGGSQMMGAMAVPGGSRGRMERDEHTWWKATARWVGGALALVAFAAVLVPHMAQRTAEPLFVAMAAHANYLYAAAGIMLLIGCVDGILLYRRARMRPGSRA